VASTARRILEEAVVGALDTFMKDLLEYIVYTVALNWDEVQKKLLESGANPEPSTEQILMALEELADKVDVDEAIKHADENTRRVVSGLLTIGLGLARRFAPREWVEKLTYDNVVRQAEKRNMHELLHYLKSYPKLCTKIIDWLRSKVMEGRDERQ
jgi:hypothetical protein